ncbi:MAG TPA: VOC family protein [Acidimicrobiales bacterium]|jgi:catechol 2,3-dioxygenase-like lactoylglutathione lyase family enzyme|nr:VOC family protein [Acidimicrobiales bacterium]
MPLTFSHFGICVADLDRSLRFYCEGLGFTEAERHQIGPEFALLMELDDVKLTSQFVRQGDTAIELLAFEVPTPEGERARRAINQLGLTHLSFRVGDLPGTAVRLKELGGTVVEATRTTFDLGGTALDFLYCTDPDGVRIELMDLGG